MISIPSNSIKQTLQQYLLQYKTVFKKRSFNIFCLLVMDVFWINFDSGTKKWDKVITNLWNLLCLLSEALTTGKYKEQTPHHRSRC